MASEGERCGGLGSFLAMSCRGRAEAFARSLHSKLRSLGTQDENGSVDESSWLAAHENPITISQPAHSTNTDSFLDLTLVDCPGSPENELNEVDFNKLMNKDTLQIHSKEIDQTSVFAANSIDSDSDLPFYDTEDRRIAHQNHTIVNGVDINSTEDEDDIDTYQNLIDCSSTSDCTSQQAASLSEDSSMFSLQDLDGSLTDLSSCNGDINQKCDNTDVRKLVSEDKNVDCVKSYEKGNIGTIIEEDEEDDSENLPRVRRCTSLKTGKTPPGTPGQKKIVRFADAMGLDLADVRTFLDDIPKVPVSAFDDLINADFSDSSESNISKVQLKTTKYLMPLFQQPGGMPNFLDFVREYNVCLENVFVDDPFLLSLKGSVRVRNLDFNKSVHIRYSLDGWKTFADVQATYAENSCDGFSDKFTFLLYAHTLSIGQRLELACRFQCKGCQYWDNNRGANYCFQCLPSSNSNSTHAQPAVDRHHDDWERASFY